MLTLAETLQYEPIMVVILILGLVLAIFGAVILITKKEKNGADIFFSISFILIGIILFLWFAGFVSFSSITYESITPCNIILNGNYGLVASVEGGTYSAYPSEMLKLHINQTREVLVLNEWGSRYSVIKEVPGVNCPSGAATRC